MPELHLDHLTNSRLAELYNEWADGPVAKFASKAAAIARIGRLCEERGLRVVRHEAGSTRLVPGNEGRADDAGASEAGADAEEPASAADDSPPQAPQTPAGADPEATDTTPRRKQRSGGGRAPAAAGTDSADAPATAIIRVVQVPAAREGTHRAARLAALRDGITVGQYLDAAHEANSGRRARGRYRADVRRLVARGAIRLEG